MDYRTGRVLVLAMLVVLALPAGSLAQVAPTVSSLSDSEKTAIATILDDLGTKQGDALRSSVLSVLDSAQQNNQNINAIVSAAKLGAGTNLPAFQSILVGACLGGTAQYCNLAALRSADPNPTDIQTAATGAAGGGGDAGGFGGGAQTNSGHSSASGTPSSGGSLFVAAPQDFGLSFRSNFTTLATTPSVSAFSVPSPLAGAGLPSALTFLALLFWPSNRKLKRGQPI